MTPHLESFKHFMIVRDAGGEPARLSRAPDELGFAAFDRRAERAVELHVLPASAEWDAGEKRSVLERAALAAELDGWTFMQILEAGEDDGIIYYTSTLNDGELVGDYVARRGPLPPVTALCLVLQLLEDLIQLESYHRLMSRLSLRQLLVTVVDQAYLHLRVLDFGLCEKEKRGDDGLKTLSVEICELIFLLLVGRPFAGEDVEATPELICVPPGLHSMLHTVLTDNTQAPETPDVLRDTVDVALAALMYHIQTDDARKHLLISSENPPPRLPLQELDFTPIETPAPVLDNPAPITAMALEETLSDFDAPADIPARPRRGIHRALIWGTVTAGAASLFLWLSARDGETSKPAKQEAPVVAAPAKPSPPPPVEPPKPVVPPAEENPVVVRKAIVPSADEIEELRRQQTVGAKDKPQSPVTKRKDANRPTANR